MKTGRKLLLLVAAIIALMVCFAFGVSADTEYTEGYYTYTVENDEAVITEYNGSEVDIIIPDTLGGYRVTSIEDEAFSDCDRLIGVKIPDSVTSIGYSAFNYCYSLANITIPDSVTSVGGNAFSSTAYYDDSNNWEDGVLYVGSYLIGVESDFSVSDYTVKSGTKVICDGAFYYCSELVSIAIPDTVINVGEGTFVGCDSLTNIVVDKNNEYYESVDGVLFNKDKSVLLQYPIAKSAAAYNIPDGVETIGVSAFDDCKNIESITIPNSVTTICDDSFAWCSSLISIIIPDSVTSIGGGAFSGCESLESAVLPNGITTIINHMFYGCTNLKSVTIPDSVTGIGSRAFLGCSSLSNISIPDSVTSIGGYAFADCTNLINITIPDSVTSIGESAFYNTGYYNDKTNWIDGVLYINNHLIEADDAIVECNIKDGTKTIADEVFYDCNSLISVTIPDSVTVIGGSAFSDCSSLKNIILPSNLTTIGAFSFYRCVSIESLAIPATVSIIGDAAFVGCTSLVSVTVDEDNQFYSTDSSGVLFDKEFTNLMCYPLASSFTEYAIPDTVNSLGYYVFRDMKNLKELSIPASVTYIDLGRWAASAADPFGAECLESIVVDANNPVYASADGVLFNKEMTELLRYPDGKKDKEYIVPEGVETFGWASFTSAVNLEKLVLPTSIASISYSFISRKSPLIIRYLGTEEEWNNRNVISYNPAFMLNGYTMVFGDVEPTTQPTTKPSTTAPTTTAPTTTKPTTTAPTTTTKPTTTAPATQPSIEEKEPENIKAKSVKTNSVKITWDKVDGADSYIVYYSTNGKKWTKKTTKANTITVKKLKAGTKYQFKVVAVADGKESEESQVFTTSTKPAKVTLKSVKSTKAKRAVVTWNTVKGANGYQVTYSTSKKFTKKTTKNVTVKKQKTKKTTLKKLKSGKKYFVKVRAYKTVNGKQIYGAYSKVMTVKVK